MGIGDGIQRLLLITKNPFPLLPRHKYRLYFPVLIAFRCVHMTSSHQWIVSWKGMLYFQSKAFKKQISVPLTLFPSTSLTKMMVNKAVRNSRATRWKETRILKHLIDESFTLIMNTYLPWTIRWTRKRFLLYIFVPLYILDSICYRSQVYINQCRNWHLKVRFSLHKLLKHVSKLSHQTRWKWIEQTVKMLML